VPVPHMRVEAGGAEEGDEGGGQGDGEGPLGACEAADGGGRRPAGAGLAGQGECDWQRERPVNVKADRTNAVGAGSGVELRDEGTSRGGQRMASERRGAPVGKAAKREYDQHEVSGVPTGSKKRTQ